MTQSWRLAMGAAATAAGLFAAALLPPMTDPLRAEPALKGSQDTAVGQGLAGIAAPALANAAPTDEPPKQAAAPEKPTVEMPPCASNPELLGLSRIVEINTETGPRFGDQYRTRSEVPFLEDHEVILTFDDGPLKRYTEPILDALDAQCTRATFFSVGRMAIADPVTLKDVIKRGHTVGVHTWSHKNLSKAEAKDVKYEFELGLSAVSKAAGVPIAPFFRFPYLADNRAALDYIGKRGMGIFGIHVDSKDFRTRSPGTVLKNVMAQLEHTKKGIILFHDIQPSTAGAVASLLAELKTAGFKVVHMIPGSPVTTLPEFDTIAARALAAKAKTAAVDPMASRAVTWPVSTSAPSGGTEGSEVLPWLPKTPTAEPAQPRAPKAEKPQKKAAKAQKSDAYAPKSHTDINTLGN